MNIDLKLIKDADGNYDIAIADNGDFVLEDGFGTAILMSIFGEKRLTEGEQPEPSLQGGYWGNILSEVPNYEVGSKLWALDNRRTQDTLNKAIDFANDGLQWFVDTGLLKDVTVDGSFTSEGIKLEVTLIRFNNQSETFFYDLWENTNF